jgi:hypothetical protein
MKLVGERRAVAAAVLAFYALFFTINALLGGDATAKAMGALASAYGLAFFALVAGYFWARWYSIGLGLFGLITTAVGMWQIGPEPVLIFFGATHGAVALVLWGGAVAELFDGRTDWRARFHLDEHGVHRLGRAVIRIGISLPYILLYALAPRGMGDALLALGVLGLAGAGAYGLLHLRTWGLFALTGAGAWLLADAADGAGSTNTTLAAIAAGALLLAAVAPFARAILAKLRA